MSYYVSTGENMQENKIKISDQLLTGKEVREKLRVNRQTLNKYCLAGKLSPIKVSERKFLYEVSQIEEFLNSRKTVK
jgi:predicted site-specific integrase-resolvase